MTISVHQIGDSDWSNVFLDTIVDHVSFEGLTSNPQDNPAAQSTQEEEDESMEEQVGGPSEEDESPQETDLLQVDAADIPPSSEWLVKSTEVRPLKANFITLEMIRNQASAIRSKVDWDGLFVE